MTGSADVRDRPGGEGLVLEVRLVSAEPPRGCIRSPEHGVERAFHGWIDFMGRIHELVDEAAGVRLEGGTADGT